MSNIPSELKYLSSLEWVRVEADGETAVIGITDHAQELLGDVVFVEVPELGAEIAAGDEAGVVVMADIINIGQLKQINMPGKERSAQSFVS